jgi:lysophospholipase L1-like esterase
MRLLSNTTFLAAVLATAVSCGGKNPNPIEPPPPGSKLELACPTVMIREATTPQGTDVHFDSPTPTGGKEPYNVGCEPGSGSVFPIGESTVRCTAKDADMAQASCEFPVSVRVSRTITKTKFTAFGDSITQGAISLAPLVMLDGPETYPFKLEQMLRERYLGQEIVVTNRGEGGERTNQGVIRLPSVLDADRPEVLLLLEGINAINLLSTSRQEGYLRTMITDAKKRNVEVIIATVMPVAPNGKLQPAAEYMTAIRALNARIITLALEQNIGNVVDLFTFFETNMHLLGVDGLHPTSEGQTRIAELFRDEIVRRYDASSTTSLRFSSIRYAR